MVIKIEHCCHVFAGVVDTASIKSWKKGLLLGHEPT